MGKPVLSWFFWYSTWIFMVLCWDQTNWAHESRGFYKFCSHKRNHSCFFYFKRAADNILNYRSSTCYCRCLLKQYSQFYEKGDLILFTSAIVKTPCKNMVKGITTANLGYPDYKLALKQHENYIQVLEQCGLRVIVLKPDENFPDSTFIEDTCLITPRCAIITNPGAASRENETISIGRTVKELDIQVEYIQNPGTLDAGDIMMVNDHYFTGISERTNIDGASQLNYILKKYNFTSSTIKLEKVLHLKTGISYLENNNLLAVGEFLTKPELKSFNILEVDKKESYAANSVWINGYVLVPEKSFETKKMIENAGYKVIEVDVSEFKKLDGGLSCLSLRF